MEFKCYITKNKRITIPVEIRDDLKSMYNLDTLKGFNFAVSFKTNMLTLQPLSECDRVSIKLSVDSRNSIGIPKKILDILKWNINDELVCVSLDNGGISLYKVY